MQITLDERPTEFVSLLQSRALALIGIEEGICTPQRRLTALWHVFPHIVAEIEPEKMPVAFWVGVRTAATRQGHAQLGKVCASIAFSLTAMERHLLSLSNEYNRELHTALERGTKPKSRFSSVETYDLWLAIHAFFLAAASARDYLAQALVDFVYNKSIGDKIKKRPDSMRLLIEDGRKRGYLNKLPIGSKLLSITDKNEDSAWLADMSEYRNVIAHRAPITSLSKGNFLELHHTGSFGEHDVLQVIFSLPDKPRSLNSPTVTDALNMVRYYNERMAGLAFEVGKLMPYRPESITLTEEGIVDIERL